MVGIWSTLFFFLYFFSSCPREDSRPASSGSKVSRLEGKVSRLEGRLDLQRKVTEINGDFLLLPPGRIVGQRHQVVKLAKTTGRCRCR